MARYAEASRHVVREVPDSDHVFLQEGKVTFFGSWSDFEKTDDPFLRNFRLQDELIPSLDVTL